MITATSPSRDVFHINSIEDMQDVVTNSDTLHDYDYKYKQRHSKTRRICRTYCRIKEQIRTSPLPFKAAFSNSQFEQMMREWGLDASKEDDLKQIASIGMGCYIRKCDKEELVTKMQRNHDRVWNYVSSSIDRLIVALTYEMENIEWCINLDDYETKCDTVWDAICGEEDIDENVKYCIINVARAYYYATMPE